MIPTATTTVRVLRWPPPAEDAEVVGPYEDRTAGETVEQEVVVEGVRAHISTGAGAQRPQGQGTQEIVIFRMACDPCDVQHGDTVEDAAGEQYEVVWARRRRGLGLDHMQVGMRQVSGEAVAGVAR